MSEHYKEQKISIGIYLNEKIDKYEAIYFEIIENKFCTFLSIFEGSRTGKVTVTNDWGSIPRVDKIIDPLILDQ